MKSIIRRYKNIETRNPGYSTYICFANAIIAQNFSEQTISRWFNKLVSKNDYTTLSDKKDIIRYLVNLAKPSQDNKK